MRVCIYKTDEAPDLTLFLQEGLALPAEANSRNWIPLKTITRGELNSELMAKMTKAGYCVERLGRQSEMTNSTISRPPIRKISLRWLGFPRSIKT